MHVIQRGKKKYPTTEEILISDIHLQDLRTHSRPCSIWLLTRKDNGCLKGKCCWLIVPQSAGHPYSPENTTESCSYSVPSQQQAWLIFARGIQAGKVSSNQECRASHQVVLPGLHPNCFTAWNSLWSCLKLPSVKKIWSSRYRLLPQPDTGFILCLQSFSWTLEPFFALTKTIKWVHLEYTGQKYQHQIKSGLQRSHKNTVFRD